MWYVFNPVKNIFFLVSYDFFLFTYDILCNDDINLRM